MQTGKQIFGYQFSPLTAAEVVDHVVRPVPAGEGVRLVVTANLDHIVQLRRLPAFREAYSRAYIRTIDGAPVMIYGWFRGVGVPERVTGADLVPDVLSRMRPGEHRLGFVAANDRIAQGLHDWALRHGFSDDDVVIDVPPFGFENDPDYTHALVDRIHDHRVTHLFMGVGCSKSEIWADRNRTGLGDVYVLAVGASLSYFVGAQKRAPAWMRQIGLEWFWRVLQEPRRLGQRYFIDSWGFVSAIAADLIRGRTRS